MALGPPYSLVKSTKQSTDGPETPLALSYYIVDNFSLTLTNTGSTICDHNPKYHTRLWPLQPAILVTSWIYD